MKKALVITSCLFIIFSAAAQDPVHWNYTAKKTGEIYEIHITASIDEGWHLYSQTQPEEAIAVPTSIKFNGNPLLIFNGKIKESGKMEKHKEPTLGIEQWQYSNKVDFMQSVKLKVKAMTNVSGTIEYQVCTNEMCLPPKTISFNVSLK